MGVFRTQLSPSCVEPTFGLPSSGVKQVHRSAGVTSVSDGCSGARGVTDTCDGEGGGGFNVAIEIHLS